MYNMDEKILLLDIGKQIVSELQLKPSLTCGLMGGDFGKIMYLYECSRIEKDMEREADMMLDKLFGTYRIRPYLTTYCNGLSGFGIGLQLLEKGGYIQGASCQMSEFDSRLHYALRYYLVEGNIDFLHGATGLGFYFIDRIGYSEEIAEESLRLYIDRLFETALEENSDDGPHTIKWIFDRHTAIKRYNMSLSHGISGNGILLAKIVKSKCDSELIEKCRYLLKGIKSYLMSQTIDFDRYGSFFPSFPKDCMDEIRKSRLAWCYGDLGVIFALINIGEALQDVDTTDSALKMAVVCADKRRGVPDNMVYDACICHGASGVAQAFSALYRKTGYDKFADAYSYWRTQSLKMGVYENGHIDFRNYGVTNRNWRKTNSFLEGNAGVGLMLLNSDYILDHILLYGI